MVLCRLIGENGVRGHRGFYVDVGAHHPTFHSNTFAFYQRGWSGIVVEPARGAERLFRRARPRDIFLPYAVSPQSGPVDFFEFDQPLINTASASLAAERASLKGRALLSTRRVDGRTLGEILEAHAPEDRRIDLLTIDIEGLDLDVLASLDPARWRPTVIVAEDESMGAVASIDETGLGRLLASRGYRCISRLVLSAIFVAGERLEQTPLGPRLALTPTSAPMQ
jgi:FkbM family methyltransferase